MATIVITIEITPDFTGRTEFNGKKIRVIGGSKQEVLDCIKAEINPTEKYLYVFKQVDK